MYGSPYRFLFVSFMSFQKYKINIIVPSLLTKDLQLCNTIMIHVQCTLRTFIKWFIALHTQAVDTPLSISILGLVPRMEKPNGMMNARGVTKIKKAVLGKGNVTQVSGQVVSTACLWRAMRGSI